MLSSVFVLLQACPREMYVRCVCRGAVLNFKSPIDAENGSNLQKALASLRVFRIPLALWNVLILFLMVVWFP